MFRFIVLIFSAISFSCNPGNADKNILSEKDTTVVAQASVAKENFQHGIVLTNVKCLSDNSQSFALYIPKNTDSLSKLPVVYFFDSHGDGSLPLMKYKNIADTYNFILIGSNNSKNGNDWNTTSHIWAILSNDTKQRLNLNESQIYTAGFSGGAKVASFIATTTEVKSVIANSAAFDEVIASPNPFSFIALAGTGDMNMSEVVNQNNELNKTARQHQLILFDGKHEWAPEVCIKDAFWFLYSNNLMASKQNADKSIMHDFLKTKTEEVKSLQAKNNLIKAEQVCRFVIQTTASLNADILFFKETQKNILKNPLYQQQLITEENLLKTESAIKEELMQKLSNPDMKIWQPVINDFNARIKKKNIESPVYERLLAFVSLACYSLSNRNLSADKNIVAAGYVELYKKADPTNSEAWYFSSVINARNKNAPAVENDLNIAIEKGFNDINRMQAQPEFQNLNTQIDFSKLIAKIEAHQKR